jgi:hypothetical protein
LNYHLTEPTDTYYQEIEKRIQSAGCRVKKDSVKFVDTLITASPEFFNKGNTKAYFQQAFDFMTAKIGRDNIFSAVVHLDEKTPHMHLCFTPITPDHRLTAKEILGNRSKLAKWQDDFFAHMEPQFSGLERGRKAIETKREHIPVQLFKQATMLNNQLLQIQFTLSSMNMLNSGKRRDEALKLLKTWYPEASQFMAQIKKIQSDLQETKTENNKLTDEISHVHENSQQQAEQEFTPIIQKLKRQYKAKDEELDKLLWEYRELQETCDKYQAFVDTIPENLFKKLRDNYSQQKREQQEQEHGWGEMEM